MAEEPFVNVVQILQTYFFLLCCTDLTSIKDVLTCYR